MATLFISSGRDRSDYGCFQLKTWANTVSNGRLIRLGMVVMWSTILLKYNLALLLQGIVSF